MSSNRPTFLAGLGLPIQIEPPRRRPRDLALRTTRIALTMTTRDPDGTVSQGFDVVDYSHPALEWACRHPAMKAAA